MNIIEKITALLSLFMLTACMLAPLRRSSAAQKHPWIRRFVGFHTFYGITLLVTGLIHGLLAGGGSAMMTGKLAWTLLLFLTLLAPLKKRMKQNTWRRMHLTLAVSGCALVVIHILQAVLFHSLQLS